jgi:AraC-like DNA-binding protein
LGFVIGGSFAAKSLSQAMQEFGVGEGRWCASAESLQLSFSERFDGLVGELIGIEWPLAVAEDPADSFVPRDLLTKIARDATSPALVQLERWALARSGPSEARRKTEPWLADLVEELESGRLDSRPVRRLARHTGRHRSTLHRNFRRALGIDPSAWILRERMRRAWELLATDQPLIEIAIDCGFADQSHMNRVFRSLTGYSPGALRRQRRASGHSERSDATRIQEARGDFGLV